jgi:hypothetical protein
MGRYYLGLVAGFLIGYLVSSSLASSAAATSLNTLVLCAAAALGVGLCIYLFFKIGLDLLDEDRERRYHYWNDLPPFGPNSVRRKHR